MSRRSQTEHIRAAREWLGRAEDSLAQENDVQGDLKLMLAKAELAHVGNCPRSQRLIAWGRRALALLIAAGLALVILWRQDANISREELPAEYTSSATTKLPTENAAQVPESTPEPQREQVLVAPSADSLPQPLAPEPVPGKRNAVEEPAPAAPPIEKNEPPDAAKQQLMQSAGKILRQ